MDRAWCVGLFQAFNYNDGSNYVFVNIYNDSSHETNPLHADGTGIVNITGSSGQEDVVIQSAYGANTAFGK